MNTKYDLDSITVTTIYDPFGNVEVHKINLSDECIKPQRGKTILRLSIQNDTFDGDVKAGDIDFDINEYGHAAYQAYLDDIKRGLRKQLVYLANHRRAELVEAELDNLTNLSRSLPNKRFVCLADRNNYMGVGFEKFDDAKRYLYLLAEKNQHNHRSEFRLNRTLIYAVENDGRIVQCYPFGGKTSTKPFGYNYGMSESCQNSRIKWDGITLNCRRLHQMTAQAEELLTQYNQTEKTEKEQILNDAQNFLIVYTKLLSLLSRKKECYPLLDKSTELLRQIEYGLYLSETAKNQTVLQTQPVKKQQQHNRNIELGYA